MRLEARLLSPLDRSGSAGAAPLLELLRRLRLLREAGRLLLDSAAGVKTSILNLAVAVTLVI